MNKHVIDYPSLPIVLSKWLILVMLVGFAACNPAKEETVANPTEKYTCPMHPQIVQEAPGTCPICKMDLVKKESGGKENTQIVLSQEQIKLANIQTQAIQVANFSATKVLNAVVVASPEAEALISSRYAGRIDKLWIKEDGAFVNKGQALFQIYSEEIQALQLDYLLQLKQERAFPKEAIYRNLKAAAKNKLLLYGFTAAQLATLERNGKPSALTTVYARVSGTVRELEVVEGAYIQEGSVLMRIQDLRNLWVEADVYPAEAGLVKKGAAVAVSVEGMPAVQGKIDFVSPVLESNTQVLKARINIRNTGNYQPGMHASVSLLSERVNNAVLLPVDAVLLEENASYIWIKTANDTFEKRKVETGMEDENSVVVTEGLENVKEVVVSGAYLLNSELQLR